VSFRASFPGPNARPWRWDPQTGQRAPYPYEEGDASLWIRLEPSESLLLVLEPRATGPSEAQKEPVAIRSSLSPTEWRTLSGAWQVTFRHVIGGRSFERTLRPLEDLSLSPDPELATFAGVVTYRTTFEVPGGTRFDRLDLGAANGVVEVTLNGQPLGASWWGRHLFDLGDALEEGSNTLEVEVTTVVANYARSLKDNPAAKRWTWWYPPISTGLVGPVQLIKSTP
jgi:hypothetical protein